MQLETRNHMFAGVTIVLSSLPDRAIRLTNFLQSAVRPEQLLGWSLGVVYLWFGALKIGDVSPVVGLLQHTYPALAARSMLHGLGFFECALGTVLLAGIWKRWSASACILHLAGTLGLLVFCPREVFHPGFPALTMEGEFVLKNLVLIAASGALWVIECKRITEKTSRASGFATGDIDSRGARAFRSGD